MISIFRTTITHQRINVLSRFAVLLLTTLFLTIFLPKEGCSETVPRYLYLVPEGYIGYVQVNFNVERAAPLLREGDYLLIKIPPSGIVNTSSAMIETTKFPYQRDVFFYYSFSGDRRPMAFPACGGGHTRSRIGARVVSWIFFVGTCHDFEKLKDRIFNPGGENIIGPQVIR
jgi:hypothetical protein